MWDVLFKANYKLQRAMCFVQAKKMLTKRPSTLSKCYNKMDYVDL